jgi:cystathionine beta-synthase
VLFPDTGRGYLSKQFNDTWMRENNMLVQAETDELTLHDVLTHRRTHSRTMPLVVSVAPGDSIADAVELLRRYGISQTPVIEKGQVVGSLTENLLLRHLAGGEPLESMVVRDLQGPPFAELQAGALAHEAYTFFSSGQYAVAVMNGDELEGIVTKSDLLDFWAHTRNQ